MDYAIVNGFKTVAEDLIEHGAHVNVRGQDGDRPLHIAARQGYLSLAELLLAHNADVNAPGKDGETPLFRAIQMNRLDMVQFLLSNKADVNLQAEFGKTPLLAATATDTIDIAIVKALLDNGAGVEAAMNGSHPLDTAINRWRSDLVELLLKHNADPNIQGRFEQAIAPTTPLIYVTQRDSQAPDAESKILTLLLNHGANPDRADDTDETPLRVAIFNRETNIVEELIRHHADVNAPDKEGIRLWPTLQRSLHTTRRRSTSSETC